MSKIIDLLRGDRYGKNKSKNAIYYLRLPELRTRVHLYVFLIWSGSRLSPGPICAYCALNAGLVQFDGWTILPLMMKVQSFTMLILLAEGVLVGVVIQFKEDDANPEEDNKAKKHAGNNQDPNVALAGRIIIGLMGFVFYWLIWAELFGYL